MSGVRILLLPSLLACGGDDRSPAEETGAPIPDDTAFGDTDPLDTAETDSGDTAHPPDPTDAAGCVNLLAGPWNGVGPAFGMPMSVTLVREAGSCTFHFEDWSMQHGDLPEGGTVEGARVILSGPAEWSGCEGTATNSRWFEGACVEDRYFEFSYGE